PPAAPPAGCHRAASAAGSAGQAGDERGACLRLLGLEPGASRQAVRARYLELAKERFTLTLQLVHRALGRRSQRPRPPSSSVSTAATSSCWPAARREAEGPGLAQEDEGGLCPLSRLLSTAPAGAARRVARGRAGRTAPPHAVPPVAIFFAMLHVFARAKFTCF
ncbi:unnamed protein product, partial [Prorocentrum cordatum]